MSLSHWPSPRPKTWVSALILLAIFGVSCAAGTRLGAWTTSISERWLSPPPLEVVIAPAPGASPEELLPSAPVELKAENTRGQETLLVAVVDDLTAAGVPELKSVWL